MKILIATPCAQGQVHYKYLQSLLTQTFLAEERLQDQATYQLALYTVAGVSGLGKDRGVIASYALRNNFDKLFFIDADQSWSWPQFKAIADSKRPITAGVVALKNYPVQLNFTPRTQDADCFEADSHRVTPTVLQNLYSKYQQDTIEVQVLGTGFTCLDVLVLKALVEQNRAPEFFHKDTAEYKDVKCWDFFQSGVVNGAYIGEDWAFCIQAARLGFRSYINPTVHITHHGQHEYIVGKEVYDKR